MPYEVILSKKEEYCCMGAKILKVRVCGMWKKSRRRWNWPGEIPTIREDGVLACADAKVMKNQGEEAFLVM